MGFSYGGYSGEADRTARPDDATPCYDTRESRLAGQLSALVDDLMAAAHQLSHVSDRLAVMAPADAEISCRRVIRRLLTTLNDVADSDPDTSGRKSSIRLCVETYINHNLSSKTISPESIYKELEIARSSLYKAFSDSGGVAKYIQDRRLDVARALLARPEEHRSLTQIADSLGFESGARFSKAFRRRFGYPPRNARIKLAPRLR